MQDFVTNFGFISICQENFLWKAIVGITGRI